MKKQKYSKYSRYWWLFKLFLIGYYKCSFATKYERRIIIANRVFWCFIVVSVAYTLGDLVLWLKNFI